MQVWGCQWSYSRPDTERGEQLPVRIEKTKKRMLYFVDKIEIRLLGLEKKRKQPAMKTTGEAVGILLEIYSGKRKDAKVATTVSALVGRSVLISLVPLVVEANVATLDGLESTIKSARDRKRWKLAAV
ncbi:hypothetical protein BHE74_00005283 [Ensete ventricosum]|nr:hypothetical protein BHE74_00005283 [Ensete ventricosum]